MIPTRILTSMKHWAVVSFDYNVVYVGTGIIRNNMIIGVYNNYYFDGEN